MTKVGMTRMEFSHSSFLAVGDVMVSIITMSVSRIPLFIFRSSNRNRLVSAFAGETGKRLCSSVFFWSIYDGV